MSIYVAICLLCGCHVPRDVHMTPLVRVPRDVHMTQLVPVPHDVHMAPLALMCCSVH